MKRVGNFYWRSATVSLVALLTPVVSSFALRALDECSSSTNIFQGLDVEGGHPEDGRREVEGGAADRSADGDRGAAERDRRLPGDGPTSGARRR